MTEGANRYPLLSTIDDPADLRRLDEADLPRLAEETRRFIVDTVSITGGHLGANLGVVELSIALHYVFDTPGDRLIWDVGHQCYTHKVLTGRRKQMRSLRQGGGLSGFTKRDESVYDPFGAAHSSTSISAGLGMSVGAELKGRKNNVIAVIGDGAMSAGMAYEAMNNAGSMDARLIVILNDNDMSIDRPVGALSKYLSELITDSRFRWLRAKAKGVAEKLPPRLKGAVRLADEFTRGVVTGSTLFEELGFFHVGPIDGHDFEHLLPVLYNLRDDEDKGPLLLHVITNKGHGYPPAEEAADKLHGVGKFNVVTGKPLPVDTKAPSYTKVFSNALVRAAETDKDIVAVTAAMPSGTGLDIFAQRFPDRIFDVGIAEQHAVTFAAGLACEGLKPFCAIYSTFLQRAFDQVVHDVDLQNLPVRFAIDRAGLVGADGPTHAGAYDLTFLGALPNMAIMAPADEAELVHMVATASAYDQGPIAFRYPRGEGTGVALPDHGEILEIGRGRILREGTAVALLSLGTRLAEVMKAADDLAARGYSVTVADARFAKPLDRDLVLQLARNHPVLLTVEENAIGGFASQVMQLLAMEGALDGGLRIRPLILPDRFIDHESPARQYEQAGLNAANIVNTALVALGQEQISTGARA